MQHKAPFGAGRQTSPGVPRWGKIKVMSEPGWAGGSATAGGRRGKVSREAAGTKMKVFKGAGWRSSGDKSQGPPVVFCPLSLMRCGTFWCSLTNPQGKRKLLRGICTLIPKPTAPAPLSAAADPCVQWEMRKWPGLRLRSCEPCCEGAVCHLAATERSPQPVGNPAQPSAPRGRAELGWQHHGAGEG